VATSCPGSGGPLYATDGRPRHTRRHPLNFAVAGIETTLLWRRGENLEAALARLASIKVDPAAGRAPRDEMHPAFESIDRWVPRPVRSLLTEWAKRGALHGCITKRVGHSEERKLL
jgi:hypothetical protein